MVLLAVSLFTSVRVLYLKKYLVALNVAAKHPSRADRVFAYAANYNTRSGLSTSSFHLGTNPSIHSGTYDVTKSVVFTTYISRTVREYADMSPTPDQYEVFRDDIFNMWASQPSWNQTTFKNIDGSKICSYLSIYSCRED